LVAKPLWFGESHLFGFLHVPDDGMARGSVVICPPLGSEHLWAYAALRRLADELENIGFVVLRFDYAGTGQSAGDLQTQWPKDGLSDSVTAALELVRTACHGPVALVGMRLGAILAGLAVAEGETAQAVVLWDPVISGRAFLREQRVLRMLIPGQDRAQGTDSAVVEERSGEILGFVYGDEGVADLNHMDLRKAAPGLAAVPVLALVAPTTPEKSAARLRADIVADWQEAPGLQDTFFSQTIPEEGVRKATVWLDATLPITRGPTFPAEGSDRLDVGPGPGGQRVTEAATTLGPQGLFAIVTEASGTPHAPLVVFLDQALEPPVGPGRLWVDLARQLAGTGVRVVRFNCSGIGDSPVRPGQSPHLVAAPQAVQDVLDVAGALSPVDPHQVVLIGLSSGAYNALQAARILYPLGVCAINPPTLDASSIDPSGSSERHAIGRPRRPWLQALSESPRLDQFRLRMPELAWRLLDASRVARSPAHGLEPLSNNGVEVLLVCGLKEGRQFDRRGGWIARRLERGGHLRFELIPGMDHTLYYPEKDRQTVRSLIVEHLQTCVAAATPIIG
jgi:alpha-beta hydrolase superfamily lysophospholipase